MTISASIPAAIISKEIHRLFKESNILENNILHDVPVELLDYEKDYLLT